MTDLVKDTELPQRFLARIAAQLANNKFLISKNHHAVNNILIPLRISAFNGCPDGAVYLQYFASVGWNIIRPIVVLAAAPLLTASLPPGVTQNLISGSASMPANRIASQIRPLWNWL